MSLCVCVQGQDRICMGRVGRSTCNLKKQLASDSDTPSPISHKAFHGSATIPSLPSSSLCLCPSCGSHNDAAIVCLAYQCSCQHSKLPNPKIFWTPWNLLKVHDYIQRRQRIVPYSLSKLKWVPFFGHLINIYWVQARLFISIFQALGPSTVPSTQWGLNKCSFKWIKKQH